MLILHCPFIAGSPSLRVGSVISVPVVRGSEGKEEVVPLHQDHMQVTEQNIVTFPVQRRRFLCLRVIWLHLNTVAETVYYPCSKNEKIPVSPGIRNREHLTWLSQFWLGGERSREPD